MNVQGIGAKTATRIIEYRQKKGQHSPVCGEPKIITRSPPLLPLRALHPPARTRMTGIWRRRRMAGYGRSAKFANVRYRTRQDNGSTPVDPLR